MTEKVAKKIGEAFAFAHVLADTFSKNETVMSELFSSFATDILAITNGQEEALVAIAKKYEMDGTVLPKAERTGGKILKMGDMYVGDDWDDTAEVLEWMSFFVGGAIVHWQLIEGAAQEMGDLDFVEIAKTGTGYYVELMAQLREYAIVVGKQRAQA